MKESPRITLRDRLFINSAEVFHWPAEAAGRMQDKLLDKLPDERGNKPGNTPEATDGVDESGFCLGLRDQAAILTDGTVVPCCLDSEGSIKLGNIFEDGFEYILNGERARNLYEGFSNRKAVEELCMKCSYRSRFS
jgi:radical SAM protein with 4Fe4S-binding SPASM domain